MATYAELDDLTTDVTLMKRVRAAVAIAAEAIRVEDPGTANHAERMAFAKRALLNVDGTARSLMWLLLAMNKDFTVAQIQGASDAALQTAVNNAVEVLL